MSIRLFRFACGAAIFFIVAVGLSETSNAEEPFISEVRLGALNHDIAIFGGSKEDGADVNAEILFRSLGSAASEESASVISWFFSPRPHIGASINTQGDTNLFYAGLTWDVDLGKSFFFDASFGGAVHDGEKSTPRFDKKELGCRALFRGGASLGRNITSHVNISLMLEHVSNAALCGHNEGLNNAGVRLGYRF